MNLKMQYNHDSVAFPFFLFFLQSMKSLLFVCAFIAIWASMAFSIEVVFDKQPIGFVFKNRGKAKNVTRCAEMNFVLKTRTMEKRSNIMEKQVDGLIQTCVRLNSSIDCNVLKIFLRNKLEDIENSESFRAKRDFVMGCIFWILGHSPKVDRSAVDRIQADVGYNRKLIENSTILLNKTISAQSEVNDIIFSRLNELRNITKNEELRIKFLEITQSMLLLINDDSDVADAIFGLIRQPNFAHVLRLIDRRSINDQLCKIHKKLLPNELLASGMQPNVRKALEFSKMSVSTNDNNIVIKINMPIVTGSWDIFELVPISIKGEGKVTRIKTRYRFMIDGKNDTYALLDMKDWMQFQKFENFAIGRFHLSKLHSCEYRVYSQQDLRDCEFEWGRMPRIIRANKTHVYADIGKTTMVHWQCNESKGTFRLAGSAWVVADPNCRLSMLDSGKMRDIRLEGIKLNVSTIPLNVSRWTITDQEFAIKNDNSTLSLRPLYSEVDKIHANATKPIEKIKMHSSVFGFLNSIISSFIEYVSVFIVVIVILVALRYLRK